MQKHANPWGLTPAQARAMDAICETGSHKLAAEKLRVTTKTVENHATDAKRKMQQRTSLLKYLAWDRWRQCGSK